MSDKQILTQYVYQLVNSLISSGVKKVVISPGSRSTPLAYAFASLKEVEIYRQVDERGAAFFALGLAKSKKEPTVLLCTSGTAAANYFPAIVEAKYARVPLIVITADRPHELREVGAPQAILQPNMFGEHVKWATDLPIPDDFPQTLPFVTRHISRAIAISTEAPYGPVHINVPFREPLLIDFKQLENKNTVKLYRAQINPSIEAIEDLSKIVREAKRGIIVVGELANESEMEYIWSFIRQIKWPILVESLSNMRSNVPDDCLPYVISTYDAILKNSAFQNVAKPDVVIRFGAQPVSKFLMQFIANANLNHYVVVDESTLFRDSIHTVTEFIHSEVGKWLTEGFTSLPDKQYVTIWQKAQRLALEEIHRYTEVNKDEGAYVYEFLAHLTEPTNIFASSSMPIRDIDTFLTPSHKDIRVVANRGTNGIDGVLSSALGYSTTTPSRETYLLIGDLALLHDSNGFIATRYQSCDLTIIVMNNDGGGIFSYLPQANVEAHYEDLFGTPTHLSFKELAKMYDLQYANITSLEAFKQEMEKPKEKAVRLVEVMTNREENVQAHRLLWQSISKRLDEWLN